MALRLRSTNSTGESNPIFIGSIRHDPKKNPEVNSIASGFLCQNSWMPKRIMQLHGVFLRKRKNDITVARNTLYHHEIITLNQRSLGNHVPIKKCGIKSVSSGRQKKLSRRRKMEL
jgi:hypothetical protein